MKALSLSTILRLALGCAALGSLTSTATAQGFLDQIVSGVGQVVDTTIKTVTAPIQSIVGAAQTITGQGSPSQIFKPYVDLANSAGSSVTIASQIAAAPEQFFFQRAQEAAQAAGGDAGGFVFDVATFQQRYVNELTQSTGIMAGHILMQQNPLQVTAAPLAAAIRAARERHISGAQPLPPDVRAGLAPYFSPQVLDRARWTVGNVQITLPNFIGQGRKLFSEEYAVVVDDVIVFPSQPGSFQQAAWWWAHEVTHVEQYMSWGIERFAWEFMRDFGTSVEGQANARANQLTSQQYAVSAPSQLGGFGLMGLNMQTPQAVPEYFVARAHFPMDPYPVYYMITNTGRIIVIEAMNGRHTQIGWAQQPSLPGVAWEYTTPMLRYAVHPNGGIWSVNPLGQWFQVGQVFSVQ